MSDTFKPPVGDAPDLTTEQMIEVDRAMIEDYRIELIQMMENAGRNLAHLARTRFLGGDPRGKRVVVLAGRGGNGGGAMVCARRLANWGAAVEVWLTEAPENLSGIPAHQLRILLRMQVTVSCQGEPARSGAPAADVVVDGMIGYSLSGAPRGRAAEMIRWANEQPAPVLALDAPSGLDTASGQVFEPAIRAAATLTLALPKRGLRSRPDNVGELYLADISVPPMLYGLALDMDVGPLFARDDIVRLEPTDLQEKDGP